MEITMKVKIIMKINTKIIGLRKYKSQIKTEINKKDNSIKKVKCDFFKIT